MKPVQEEILRAMPKVDLHRHLDGSARPATLLELAKKHHLPIPTEDPEEFRKYCQVSPSCRSLADFLKTFEFFYPILKNPEAVERLAWETVEDAAAENIRYLEVRLAPALQATEKFKIREVLSRAIAGMEQAGRRFKVRWGVIAIFYGSVPKEANEETLAAAEKLRDRGLVGLDRSGDENRPPLKEFAGLFEAARKRRWPFTIHAGEAAGPENIRLALEWGARRIGHGVRLREDPDLLAEIRDRGIPLEMCLTSNVQTHVVESISAHPILEYLEKKVAVTINTDDPGVSGIDLTHEYRLAHEDLGLRLADLVKCVLNGVDAAFLPEADRASLRKEVRQELDRLLREAVPTRP